MQDYTSAQVAAMICATLVNTQTHIHTDRWLLTCYTVSSHCRNHRLCFSLPFFATISEMSWAVCHCYYVAIVVQCHTAGCWPICSCSGQSGQHLVLAAVVCVWPPRHRSWRTLSTSSWASTCHSWRSMEWARPQVCFAQTVTAVVLVLEGFFVTVKYGFSFIISEVFSGTGL